jgi:hypothetical protein
MLRGGVGASFTATAPARRIQLLHDAILTAMKPQHEGHA